MPNGSGGQECSNCTYLSGLRCSYFDVDLPRTGDIVCRNYSPTRQSARDHVEGRSLLDQLEEGFIYEIVGDNPNDSSLVLRNGWYAFKKRSVSERKQ